MTQADEQSLGDVFQRHGVAGKKSLNIGDVMEMATRITAAEASSGEGNPDETFRNVVEAIREAIEEYEAAQKS